MTGPVVDAVMLRAIAHPLRQRILAELSAQGSMRAADVARELDVAPNSASFHLRQLAKYGLVVEDADAARDRRDRVWRRAHEDLTITFGEVEQGSDGGAAAVEVFRRQRASWAQDVVRRAYAEDHEEHTTTTVHEDSLRLTQEEVRELNEHLGHVVQEFAARTRGADTDAERRTYLYLGITTPYPGLEP